jgi:L-ascorbate metabolism protein UlaG (beta-lactamase superfamily)
MTNQINTSLRRLAALVGGMSLAGLVTAQEPPVFTGIQRLTNREILLRLSAPTGQNYRIEAASQLPHAPPAAWSPLVTLASQGTNQHTDSGAPYLDARMYRATQAGVTNTLTGDHLVTNEGEVVIHPLNHATFVMSWQDKMIYVDPVGTTNFPGLPRPDLILLTHSHADHFSTQTLASVVQTNTVILATLAVYNQMNAALPVKRLTQVLTNGAVTNVLGLKVEAVPAYNSNHPRGEGNGYVLTLGGRRIYISGDTGDVPEVRAIPNVDVAFVCINVPFTMTVSQAASVVRAFRPRVVYPYHYRNQGGTFTDLADFKRQVGTDFGIEVRVRKWY